MQKDLLTELHLTKLDLKNIQNIVSQNSNKLVYLLKEGTEYVKKIKTVPPHFKGVVKSMVSDCVEIKASLPRKNVKTVKRKFILRKPLLSSDNPFKNAFKNSCSLSQTPTEITTIVCNAIKESNTKNDGKYKCSEIRSFPKKCYSNSEILPNVAKLGIKTSTVTKSNSISKTGPVKDVVICNFSSGKPLDSDRDQCSASDSLLTNSHVKILKKKARLSSPTEDITNCSTAKDVEQQFKPQFDFEKESEPAFCVISKVVGNANETFFEADDSQEIIEEAPETQPIVPKKTNDITKIKGWRRKQFFVEKPTTIEFYSIARGSLTLHKKIKLNNSNETVKKANPEEPDNVKNAFVCDSLDKFLDREAELKVGFEIPHLFAEFGIKLTSNEIVSRPNLSEKDIKEVETRYCVPLSSPYGSSSLNEAKEENNKRMKRQIEYYPKPCKLLKIEESKQNSTKSAQKSTDNLKMACNKKCLGSKSPLENSESTESSKTLSNIKLVNKFIALVVYPGPLMPLHPIVQYHLAKIRSYRTKVDENWAKFAASAVLVNHKRYKRRILPVQCCVKIETKSNAKDSSSSVPLTSEVEGDNNIKNFNKNQFKLKKCSVVIEKLDSVQGCYPWCMIHNRYNCAQCGLGKSKFKALKLREFGKKLKSPDEELRETVIVSPRASFDKKIATLLAKKVRFLKYNGDTLTSIDCLKNLMPNSIEFIKLKFVKESLVTGYINIWYLESEKPEVRARAFLTFSKTSPVPNAVNLKSSAAPSLNNLPKVITEIISEENTFDSNDYAILHCNGEIWEIHGCLNIAFGKNNKNVEQIFTSVDLPELKKLQDIAFEILHVKAVKWWVLDLTQKFRLIELKSGNIRTVIIRKKFIKTIAKNLFGFLPFRRNSNNRVHGAYIFQNLLPFVLIGPYYLLETHDLTLKGDSSIIPFSYRGENDVAAKYPLKFFINSVIKNVDQNDKKLEGLWLYDKMNLDGTSYLEVVTTNLKGPLPNKNSSIDIEHGYSLSSLTSSSTSGATSGIIKRKDGKEEFKKVTVYLYFDIFELGFVEGELQFDNSVIISHPLDRRTKMKSHKIGDWFIGIIKRRIEFIPKNLVVRWFITKHKDDLRNRRPFNKFFLGGAHILTKKGVYFLLEMSDSEIERLGLNKSKIFEAIADCEVINEVKELKNLASLLVSDSSKSLSMDEVLTKAIDEIKKLKKLEKSLKSKKNVAQKEKIYLLLHFLDMLNISQIPFHIKMKMIERMEFSFRKQNGDLIEDFVKKLKIFRVGRKYLKGFEKSCNNYLEKIKENNLNEAHRADAKKKRKLKSKKHPAAENRSKEKDIQTSKKSSASLLNVSGDVIQTKADRQKYPELHLQLEKLNSISDRYSTFKNIYTKVIKNCTSDKERMKETFKRKKIKNNKFVTQNSPNNIVVNSNEFIQITSPEISDDVKIYWKKNSLLTDLEIA